MLHTETVDANTLDLLKQDQREAVPTITLPILVPSTHRPIPTNERGLSPHRTNGACPHATRTHTGPVPTRLGARQGGA